MGFVSTYYEAYCASGLGRGDSKTDGQNLISSQEEPSNLLWAFTGRESVRSWNREDKLPQLFPLRSEVAAGGRAWGRQIKLLLNSQMRDVFQGFWTWGWFQGGTWMWTQSDRCFPASHIFVFLKTGKRGYLMKCLPSKHEDLGRSPRIQLKCSVCWCVLRTSALWKWRWEDSWRLTSHRKRWMGYEKWHPRLTSGLYLHTHVCMHAHTHVFAHIWTCMHMWTPQMLPLKPKFKWMGALCSGWDRPCLEAPGSCWESWGKDAVKQCAVGRSQVVVWANINRHPFCSLCLSHASVSVFIHLSHKYWSTAVGPASQIQ